MTESALPRGNEVKPHLNSFTSGGNGWCGVRLLQRLISAALMLLSFLLSMQASAQYRIDHWTTEDRLPQNTVNAIVQTRDGYLWLGTWNGLARFDGVRFSVFTPQNT